MKHTSRLALFALSAVLLAACSDAVLTPAPSGPLNQQDVSEAVTDLSRELEAILVRAAQDAGIVALRGLPQNGAMSNPFFGYTVTLMGAKHQGRVPGALRALADYDLPRGVYTYLEDDGSEGWVFEDDSDDLTLNWTYDADPETVASDPARASATFDWDAESATAEVADGAGGTVEVPTGLNFAMTADGTSVADVDVATTYYRAAGCGDEVGGILEPTSLTVDGTGSLLNLDNVGYAVREADAGDTVTTQGQVTLVDEGVALGWNIVVKGELTRENCFTNGFVPQSGVVATEVSGLPGETRSVAFGFSFSELSERSAVIEDGSVVINGDESRAVTFSGTLDDSNANGVPGEDVTVRFADGSTRTLEHLLQELAGAAQSLRGLLRH